MIQAFMAHPFLFSIVAIFLILSFFETLNVLIRHRARTKEMKEFWKDHN